MKWLVKLLLISFVFLTVADAKGLNDVKITYPNIDTCKIVYPIAKIGNNDMDVRLKKIDLQNGIFEYYIYKNDTIVKNDLFWVNNACKKVYSSLTKTEKQKIKEQMKNIDFEDEKKVEKIVGKSIEELEKKYLNENYKSTTTQQYLTTSKYLIAVLTMNSDIIDIDASIKYNKIILKNAYAIDNNELSKKLNLDFFSFIFEWVVKSNLLFRHLQIILLGFFVPVSLGFLGFSKISRKIQGLFDTEDLIERGALGVVVFLLFFVSSNNFEAKEKNISYAQSLFQSEIGTLAKIAVDYADKLSNTLTASYVNKLKKDVGVSSKKEIERILAQNLKLEKTLKSYKALQNECYSNKKGVISGFQPDAVTSFPSSEFFQREDKQGLGLDETGYFKKWNDTSKNIRYTTSFCRNIDIAKNSIETTLKRNDDFLKDVNNTVRSNTSIKDFADTSEEMLKMSADIGFLYAPFVMFNKIFIENDGLMKPIHQTDKIENDELGLNKLMYYSPLVAAPGVDSTLRVYKELAPKQGLKKIGAKFLDGIPGVGNGLKGVVDYLLDKAGFIMITGLMAKVYNYLPLVGITIASILVICYFCITLFVYALISPFYSVYVFSTQQKESIINFLVRGIVIMFKPILIVISIIIAIIATELITKLGYTLSAQIFTFFTGNNIAFDLTLSSLIVSFLHGLVDLAIAIATTLFSFYFVFKGSDLILSVFGYKDSGIDANEIVSQVEQKISHKVGA